MFGDVHLIRFDLCISVWETVCTLQGQVSQYVDRSSALTGRVIFYHTPDSTWLRGGRRRPRRSDDK